MEVLPASPSFQRKYQRSHQAPTARTESGEVSLIHNGKCTSYSKHECAGFATFF